jgi:hypothetical protein
MIELYMLIFLCELDPKSWRTTGGFRLDMIYLTGKQVKRIREYYDQKNFQQRIQKMQQQS